MSPRRIIRFASVVTAASMGLHLPAQAAGAQDANTSLHVVRCLDRSYLYQLFSPDSATPRPAFLLLHGAGGRSSDVVDVWKPLAARERIVLIAPELSRDRSFEAIAPSVFRCMVDDARRLAAIDSERIYVFGWSMGGYLTYDAAMYASTYFAGAVVYAARIADEYYPILNHADRKIPIAIYIGDRDQHFSLAQVRATRDSLLNRGFPVHYVEFEGQDHQLAPVGEWLSADAWKYLSSFRSPTP